jgi:hypothetical protein
MVQSDSSLLVLAMWTSVVAASVQRRARVVSSGGAGVACAACCWHLLKKHACATMWHMAEGGGQQAAHAVLLLAHGRSQGLVCRTDSAELTGQYKSTFGRQPTLLLLWLQENPDLFKWLTGQQEAPQEMQQNPAYQVRPYPAVASIPSLCLQLD